jgi:hypothetical protein
MTKATHNGTCQRCGNQQAIKNGVLVNHGYVVDNGWFQGICGGTNRQPLENDTSYAEETIRFCNEQAPVLASFSGDDVRVLDVRVRVGNDRKMVQMTTEEYEVYSLGNLSVSSLAIMIEQKVRQTHRQGRMLVEHAEMLAERIKTVFGQPLVNRQALLPERVRFEFMLYSDAATKSAELKAEGFKTRISGNQRRGWALSGTKQAA